MSYSQDEIVNEYKKLKARIGRPPDSKTFYSDSPVSRAAAELAFGSKAFSKIQKAAGDKPREFRHPGRSLDEFFEQYGSVVREFQGIPKEADWKHRRLKPTPSGYRKKLGLRWSQMPGAFLEWAALKPEWADVVEICRSAQATETSDAPAVPDSSGYVYLMRSGKFHKIGRSKSPEKRGYEVGLKVPDDIKTVHVIKTDDPAGVEAYWHNRFKDKHKRGEFFELSPQDVRAFKRWKRIW